MGRFFGSILLAASLAAATGVSHSAKREDVQASKAAKAKATKSATTPKVPAAMAALAHSFATTGCDDSLWKHVYNLKKRLQIVEKCISVTGTIHHVKKEADGDDHIQLRVDSQYTGLLNSLNNADQAGSLIVEPVCVNPVIQPDAVAACRDYHATVKVPADGTHVRVLGAYVLDFESGHGWMEIHPVTKIETQ